MPLGTVQDRDLDGALFFRRAESVAVGGGRWPFDDYAFERLFGDLEVQFELQRRHAEHLAIIAEAALRAAVLGQAAGEVERQPEQILHGALVFDPCESAEVSGRIAGQFRPFHLPQQPVRQPLAFEVGKRRRFVGRHVTQVEPVEHFAPAIAVGAVGQIGIQAI